MGLDYRLFWGDSHTNLHLVPPGAHAGRTAVAGPAVATNLPEEVSADLDAALAHARQVLDFWPIAYYPLTYRFISGWREECLRDDAELQVAWKAICDLARADTRHRAKIHRAIPECGFTAALEHTDADPPRGTNHYRVRVLQRNGQAAWSSPVWVQNE